MNKERLKDLAYNVGISHTGEYARMKADDYVFLYEYALEQTERVQELEVQNQGLHIMYNVRLAKFDKVESQNKRYREVLEFYADKENYKPFNGIFLSDYQDEVDKDGGEKARKALEGEE